MCYLPLNLLVPNDISIIVHINLRWYLVWKFIENLSKNNNISENYYSIRCEESIYNIINCLKKYIYFKHIHILIDTFSQSIRKKIQLNSETHIKFSEQNASYEKKPIMTQNTSIVLLEEFQAPPLDRGGPRSRIPGAELPAWINKTLRKVYDRRLARPAQACRWRPLLGTCPFEGRVEIPPEGMEDSIMHDGEESGQRTMVIMLFCG